MRRSCSGCPRLIRRESPPREWRWRGRRMNFRCLAPAAASAGPAPAHSDHGADDRARDPFSASARRARRHDRQLGIPASPLSRIDWIRDHDKEAMLVERVARVAGMSAPTFHRHFRAVTNQSPLQFQNARARRRRGTVCSRRARMPPASHSMSVTKAPRNSVANTGDCSAPRPAKTQAMPGGGCCPRQRVEALAAVGPDASSSA